MAFAPSHSRHDDDGDTARWACTRDCLAKGSASHTRVPDEGSACGTSVREPNRGADGSGFLLIAPLEPSSCLGCAPHDEPVPAGVEEGEPPSARDLMRVIGGPTTAVTALFTET
jgi:hypothetical protein